MQQHAVVQRLVDPAMKDLLNLRKISNHPFIIKRRSAELNFDLAIVSV